jgi:hypothetical protein
LRLPSSLVVTTIAWVLTLFLIRPEILVSLIHVGWFILCDALLILLNIPATAGVLCFLVRHDVLLSDGCGTRALSEIGKTDCRVACISSVELMSWCIK